MKNIFMKKLLASLIILITGLIATTNISSATVLEGGINANSTAKNFCTVIDKTTRKPISNAKIIIPAKKFTAYSDINGHFEIKTFIDNQVILSVQKKDYKPFSMTITRGAHTRAITIELENSSPFDIKIDTSLCHLGDNNFSNFSANAGQFQGDAVGPVYNKKFYISSGTINKQHYLVIGSIIGIDTAMARGIGQSNITTSYASPPAVFLNGKKIAEIQINGDNQRIKLPKELIKYNQENLITIRAGRNLMQTAYVDYDDIEFMNISIQSSDNTNIKASNISAQRENRYSAKW